MSTINLPNKNVTGDNLWSQVEGNDQAIADVVNGNLDNSNIAAAADIAGSKLLNASVKAGKLALLTHTAVGSLVTGTADHVWASQASVQPGTYLAVGHVDTAENGPLDLRFDNSGGTATFYNATLDVNGSRSVTAIIVVTVAATIRLRGTAIAGFGRKGGFSLIGIGS